jgi:hypothetical protein
VIKYVVNKIGSIPIRATIHLKYKIMSKRKRSLEQNYSVRVENMLPIEEGEYDEWTIEDGNFDSNDGKTVIMQYLLNDNKQIFKMDDGRYVLEVENEDGTMDYYYSEDIDDLL